MSSEGVQSHLVEQKSRLLLAAWRPQEGSSIALVPHSLQMPLCVGGRTRWQVFPRAPRSTESRTRSVDWASTLFLFVLHVVHRVLLCFCSYYKQSYRKQWFMSVLVNLRSISLCFPVVQQSPKTIILKMPTNGAQLLLRTVHFTLPSTIKPPCFPTPSLKLVRNFQIITPVKR